MNPKLFDEHSRFKPGELPLDFQHQGVEKFESNWEYTKSLSTYHFDKWKEDQPDEWMAQVGRFDLTPFTELPELLARMEEESNKTGWNELSTQAVHPGFPGGVSPAFDQEEYERKFYGGGEFVQVVPEQKLLVDDLFLRFSTYFKMKRSRTRLQFQKPGQMFPMHIDKLQHRYPQDPGKMLRIIIHLADYEPGQIMQYGSIIHTKWKAGDVHVFDTNNVPHFTANASRVARPIFVITGVRTPETDEILSNSNSQTIHYLK